MIDASQSEKPSHIRHEFLIKKYQQEGLPDDIAVRLAARDLLNKHREQQMFEYRDLSLVDPLMNIWNRRALLGDEDSGEIKGGNFIPHLTREIAEARVGERRTGPREGERRTETSKPLSVLMFDLDHFKNINDDTDLGHDGGDFTLKSISSLLRTYIRKADILGRYGGEEFLIILPETNQESAIKEAERLRKLVEKYQLEFNGKKFRITISVGAAELKDSHKKPKDLVIEADKNLYQAKNNGRNKVFPPPPVDQSSSVETSPIGNPNS